MEQRPGMSFQRNKTSIQQFSSVKLSGYQKTFLFTNGCQRRGILFQLDGDENPCLIISLAEP